MVVGAVSYMRSGCCCGITRVASVYFFNILFDDIPSKKLLPVSLRQYQCLECDLFSAKCGPCNACQIEAGGLSSEQEIK